MTRGDGETGTRRPQYDPSDLRGRRGDAETWRRRQRADALRGWRLEAKDRGQKTIANLKDRRRRGREDGFWGAVTTYLRETAKE